MSDNARPEALWPAGRTEIAPRVIAVIAASAAAAVPLIAAIARPGAAQPLPPAHAHRGVEVTLGASGLTLEIGVFIASGAPIAATAEAAQRSVHAAIERALGQAPARVSIRVQGLR